MIGRWWARRGPGSACMLLAGACAATSARAAEDVTEHFTGAWYYTEVVIFERVPAMDYLMDEELTGAPLPLPRSLHLLDPETRLDARRMDPYTRACLAFPFLDRQRLLAPAPADAGAFEATPRGVRAPAIAPRLGADPLLDFLARIADLERQFAGQSGRWLPPGTLTLGAEAGRLQRRAGFRILLHGRWLQNVPPREAPESLLIHAGAAAGSYDLEGTLAVTLGRYLHFRVDLYYVEPLLGRAPIDRALAPPEAAAIASGLTATDLAPAGYMQLHESRRLRSGELHYLDHPKLGVLVRIDPVEVPQDLIDLHAALEQGEQ